MNPNIRRCLEVTTVSWSQVRGPKTWSHGDSAALNVPDANFMYTVDQAHRILHIELRGIPFQTTQSAFINNIKRIATRDAKEPDPSKRIDTVLIGPTKGDDPSKNVYDALVGLAPKHLHIQAGFEEECSFSILQDPSLASTWKNIESLTVESLCDSLGDAESPCFPLYTTFSELSLIYCCGSDFYAAEGTNLRKFKIIENDAIDMFNRTLASNINFYDTLRTIHIQSTSGLDMHCAGSHRDFKNNLKQCTQLRRLTLALSSEHRDYLLAPCFSPTIEVLDFQTPPTVQMSGDFDKWIEHAKGSSWLPKLTSLTMRFSWGDARRTPSTTENIGGGHEDNVNDAGGGHDMQVNKNSEGIVDEGGDLPTASIDEGSVFVGAGASQWSDDGEEAMDEGANDSDDEPGDFREASIADLERKRDVLFDILKNRDPAVVCKTD